MLGIGAGIGLAIVAFLLVGRVGDEGVAGTRLAFVPDDRWHSYDVERMRDPAWVADLHERYPDAAELIDSMVEMASSPELRYVAYDERDGDSGAEGWIVITEVPKAANAEGLVDLARSSLERQSVDVEPGATAVRVDLPIGGAARLDWRFPITRADGTSTVVVVRSYWLTDGAAAIAVQMTTYTDQTDRIDDVLAGLDGVARSFVVR